MPLSFASSSSAFPQALGGIPYMPLFAECQLQSFRSGQRDLLFWSRLCFKTRHCRPFSCHAQLFYPSQKPQPPKKEYTHLRDQSKIKRYAQSEMGSKLVNREGGNLKNEKRKLEGWQIQKEALKKKFKDGWNPPKKLSPDAIEGVRQLHAVAPDQFTTPVLADQFKVSPEAIRRILKSRWQPTEGEAEKRRKRWARRYREIESQKAELGLRPITRRAVRFSDSRLLYDNDNPMRPI